MNIIYKKTLNISFPFNNFKYYFTPMSWCFSSFVHTTFSLSVSPRYILCYERLTSC